MSSHHHLDTFTIKAFRGLENLTLVGLGRFNLLIGGNNSGKTSVLEAVRIFCNPRDPDELLRVALSRVSQTPFATYALPAYILWLFPCKKTDPDGIETSPVRLVGEGSCPMRSLELGSTPVEGLPSDEELAYVTKRGGRLETAPESPMSGIQISMRATFSGAKYPLPTSEITTRYWAGLPFWSPRKRVTPAMPSAFVQGTEHRASELPLVRFSELSRPQETQLIELARLFDPEVTDIRIRVAQKGTPRLSIEHARLGDTPLMTFGDGMRRVIFLATSLFAAQGGFLLLDEIESGIHPFVMPKVLQWLLDAARSLDVQIVATTHSLEAVDAVLHAARHTPDDFVTYRLSKEQRAAKRINFSLLNDLRNNGGLEIR